MDFIKYMHLERLGTNETTGIFDNNYDCYIEEKLDGGSGCLFYDSGRKEVCFGSRNRPLVDGLENGQFKANIEWIKNRINGIELNKDYLYYFEYIKRHTLKYNFDKLPLAVGFDIMKKPVKIIDAEDCDSENRQFLSLKEKTKEFKRINIPIVPVLWNGKVNDLSIETISEFIGNSKFDNTQEIKMEGIVIKTTGINKYGRQFYAKIVREEFKEENAKAFGLPDPKSGAKNIAEKYCTVARINKEINRIINEDNQKPNRSMMKILPVNVCKDILREEILNIFKDEKEIEFNSLKRIVAKRCLRTLDDFILLNSN